MACNITILAPDATAIVQDQDGNELARENIASGATQIITVNAATMINVLKGDFNGTFDLSVQDQNGFYNDYIDTETIITDLSIAANPKLGSIATVRIIGGSLAADAVPTSWNYSGDAISQDVAFYNEIMILYVASNDIRIVNRLVDAPDLTDPVFSVAPTATNIAETSFDITATLNENGTVYGYLLSNGSLEPDTDTVIANAQQSFVDSGSGGTLSFTGLVTETNYDVYVVAVDTAGNKQASPTLVEVYTQSAVNYVVWEQLVDAVDQGSGTIQISGDNNSGFDQGGYATLAINGDNSISFKGDDVLNRGSQGLGITNTYGGITSSITTMDIFMQLNQDGSARIRENGTIIQSPSWIATDEFTIRYNSGIVTIEKNSSVIYTSGESYTLPLTPIALLFDANADDEAKIRNATFENNNTINSPL